MCQSQFGSNYKALLVDGVTRVATTTGTDGTGQTNWVLKPNTKYKYFDFLSEVVIGTTNNWATFNFPMERGFDAQFIFTKNHWTGLNPNWTTNSSTCSSWNSNSSSNFGVTGRNGNNVVTSTAIAANGGLACNNLFYLQCVEQ